MREGASLTEHPRPREQEVQKALRQNIPNVHEEQNLANVAGRREPCRALWATVRTLASTPREMESHWKVRNRGVTCSTRSLAAVLRTDQSSGWACWNSLEASWNSVETLLNIIQINSCRIWLLPKFEPRITILSGPWWTGGGRSQETWVMGIFTTSSSASTPSHQSDSCNTPWHGSLQVSLASSPCLRP